MFYDFACLMLRGPGITDRIRNELCIAASELMENGSKSGRIKTDDFEGKITTEGETSVLGSISGTVFFAEVESGRGKTCAKFIMRFPLRREIFEDGKSFWMDVSTSSQNAHLN